MQLVFSSCVSSEPHSLVNKGSGESNALSARGAGGESFEIHSVVAVRGGIM